MKYSNGDTGDHLFLCLMPRVCVFLPLAERPDKRAGLRDPGDDEDEAGCRETETHRANAERRRRGRRVIVYSCEALVS